MADKETTYNGWKNYETWVTNLWITNEQGTDEAAREIVAAPFEDEDDEYPRVTAADALREWVDETYELTESCGALAGDLMRSAFERIDWFEIVDGFRADQ